MTHDVDRERTRVRIPADVDRDDYVLARLTARQVALLAGTGVVLWLVFLATRFLVPVPVFLGAAAPIAGVAVVVAFGRRDGLTLDRLGWAAVRQAVEPRRLVATTDDTDDVAGTECGDAGARPAASTVEAPPAWVDDEDRDQAALPAPLRLPTGAIRPDGVVELGADGAVVVLACSTVNFALATDAEQQAMVAGFGRWLNSLTEPVQVVVRAERVSLTPLVRRLDDAAGGLPHLALEQAAREHAAFLAQTTAQDLRARQVLLVLRDTTTDTSDDADGAAGAARLRRRGDDAARALQVCGITATALDGEAVRRLLASDCDPYAATPVGASTSIVTRRKEPTP